MQVIRNRAVESDGWLHLPAEEPVPDRGDVIVPLATWQRERDTLRARADGVGVRLGPDDDPEALAPDVAALPVIAVEFPKFADGRGYSTGRLLRERYGFTGELRAVGDVLRDQLLHMERCGFDCFELKPGKDPQDALAAFEEFSVAYQGTVDEPRPLFRRRGPS